VVGGPETDRVVASAVEEGWRDFGGGGRGDLVVLMLVLRGGGGPRPVVVVFVLGIAEAGIVVVDAVVGDTRAPCSSGWIWR